LIPKVILIQEFFYSRNLMCSVDDDGKWPLTGDVTLHAGSGVKVPEAALHRHHHALLYKFPQPLA
jgi:hypothetical protein